MNLLDLENDILKIICDYAKKDNARRIEKEEDFDKTDRLGFRSCFLNFLKSCFLNFSLPLVAP
jgi:hypothetical protein